METIYGWQERLRTRSLFVLLITFLYFYALVFAILVYVSGNVHSSLLWSVPITLGTTLYTAWYVYNRPERVVGGITGARPARSGKLIRAVEKMKAAYGIRNVRVYELPWDVINAFVVSSPDTHYLFVTEAAVTKLTDSELENVIAHEFAHMEHRDSMYMTLAVVVAGLTVLISYYLLRVLPRIRSREGGGRVAALAFIIAIFLMLLAPIVTRVLVSALSKDREFLADARAVQVTKYPPGLINALIKVARENTMRYVEEKDVPKLFGALFFDFEDVETHPPVYERVKKLSELTKTPVSPEVMEYLRRVG